MAEAGADTATPERANQRLAALLAFLIEYGTFVVVAVLLVLSSLASNIPQLASLFPNADVGIYVCLIFVALLGFVLRLVRQQAAVETRVTESIEATDSALAHVRPDFETATLTDAFQGQDVRRMTATRIRIFAITTRFISAQMRPDMNVERVDVMVAGNNGREASVPSCAMLANEVRIAVEYGWASLVRNGHIDKLWVYQYRFFPTEWYVIFDERLMLLGTYAFDEDAVGGAAPLEAVLVVHGSGAGREVIRAKIDAFDRLAGAQSKRIGDGRCEGEYELREEKVMLRGSDDIWRDLPQISQTTPA